MNFQTNISKMNSQPQINIGMLGSVSDGKSTAIRRLTGIKTQKHSNEKKRNITINVGYANMKIFEKEGILYSSDSKAKKYKDPSFRLIHHLSFVDCPGHHELILTMLGSIKLMHGVIVVVSAAEEISNKPQLIQHLAAAKLANLNNMIICFNKLDLIPKKLALKRKKELDNLLIKLNIKPKIIIPTCFSKKLGIQNLLKAIIEHFKIEELPKEDKVLFRATRSFDINKKGISWDKLQGGVIGGSLITGKLKKGDMIEVRPGFISKQNGKIVCIPIKTPILSIQTDQEKLDSIVPGGLIGLGTEIEPSYCKNNILSGSIIGLEGTLPSVYDEILMTFELTDQFGEDWNPKMNDITYLQIGTLSIQSKVKKIKRNKITFSLVKPICIEVGTLIVISRKLSTGLKIVGYGEMKDGNILIE